MAQDRFQDDLRPSGDSLKRMSLGERIQENKAREQASAAGLGDVHDVVLERDNDRGLRFRGVRLAQIIRSPGDGGIGSSGLTLDLYRTIAGAYVLARSLWQLGPTPASGAMDRVVEYMRREAFVATGPAELLAALREKSGAIRPLELALWRSACKRDPALAACEYEDIA